MISLVKILEEVEEALTPMQKLARKRAMAGKQRLIQRKKQRTMLRKKGSEQLYKKAYKAAYRDVYEFFRNRLFPDVPKEELSIIQKKQIEKWVAKKKKKVLKRARFKYLPMFREKEAEKFGGNSNIFKKDGVDESGKDKSEKNYKDWKSTNESLKDMVGDTYTFSIGSGDEKWIKPNTKEYVIEKIAETIKHNLYDWDFSLNGIDGSQAKEYSKIFDNDVLKPLLRNIDKTLKTYFKIDSKNKKISWKLSFRDNDKIIDAFFKKNKKISSDIRDSYFSQNEVAKRDYKDEYKKFQSSKKSKKYRAELNKYNRDKGTYGNGDGKDASHKGGKIVGFESEKKNRGRAEKSRLKKK